MSVEASQTHTQVFKTIYPFFDNDHFLTVQRSISYELQDNNVHFSTNKERINHKRMQKLIWGRLLTETIEVTIMQGLIIYLLVAGTTFGEANPPENLTPTIPS